MTQRKTVGVTDDVITAGEDRDGVRAGKHLCGAAGGGSLRRARRERGWHVASHRVHGGQRGCGGRQRSGKHVLLQSMSQASQTQTPSRWLVLAVQDAMGVVAVGDWSDRVRATKHGYV